MKMAYFLTVVKDVPLGYNFTLYSYGPFDSSVLEDVEYAEQLKAVTIRRDGYGYRIKPGPELERAKSISQTFLSRYQDEINWVVSSFSNETAADLELASTIVYVDRANLARGKAETVADLAREVNSIKPHFPIDKIERRIESLRTSISLQSIG